MSDEAVSAAVVLARELDETAWRLELLSAGGDASADQIDRAALANTAAGAHLVAALGALTPTQRAAFDVAWPLEQGRLRAARAVDRNA